MNVIKKYMKLAGLGVAVILSACTQERVSLENERKYTSATIDVLANVEPSRAVIPFPANYQGHYYVYEDLGLSGDYVYVMDGSFSKDTELPVRINLKGLVVGANYKVVMMAVPEGHKPELPLMNSGSWGDRTPSYDKAYFPYLDKTTKEPENCNVFRDVLTFSASPKNIEHNAVLTRQNGAVEVRIKNRKMQKVELYVNGTKTIYLNDGTGGQVLSKDLISLSRMMSGKEVAKPEVRIRVNLLPQENIAADAGKVNGSPANDPNIDTGTNKLVITDDSGSHEYPLKSNHGAIPIYPNQVTWLTLGSDGGSFDVDFSGNINLEDPVWDGWIN